MKGSSYNPLRSLPCFHLHAMQFPICSQNRLSNFIRITSPPQHEARPLEKGYRDCTSCSSYFLHQITMPFWYFRVRKKNNEKKEATIQKCAIRLLRLPSVLFICQYLVDDIVDSNSVFETYITFCKYISNKLGSKNYAFLDVSEISSVLFLTFNALCKMPTFETATNL